MVHEIPKRILKNINFENMTAVFLLVGQNSPRCEISLICCWNNDSRKKNDFRVCYGLQKWSKYHLNTIQTTFSENNNYYWAILAKISFCRVWKCIISGVFHRVSFDISDKNQLSFLQNVHFFKSLWSFHEPHNQVKCR